MKILLAEKELITNMLKVPDLVVVLADKSIPSNVAVPYSDLKYHTRQLINTLDFYNTNRLALIGCNYMKGVVSR